VEAVEAVAEVEVEVLAETRVEEFKRTRRMIRIHASFARNQDIARLIALSTKRPGMHWMNRQRRNV
jgi:hypothetical protein